MKLLFLVLFPTIHAFGSYDSKCHIPTSLEPIQTSNTGVSLNFSYRYNWYYGVVPGNKPAVLLFRTESINNCSEKDPITILYASIMEWNSFQNRYDHEQSVTIIRNDSFNSPILSWSKWKIEKKDNIFYIESPTIKIMISLGMIFLQGLNGNGMVRSGNILENTALSYSYPNAVYTFENGYIQKGYFENVKNIFFRYKTFVMDLYLFFRFSNKWIRM